MLKAVGYSDDDLAKPFIGIANTWTEIGPCNWHLRKLGAEAKRGIRAAGGTPFEFNTIPTDPAGESEHLIPKYHGFCSNQELPIPVGSA